MIKNIPYWRLSSFYGLYFASLGAFIPYLSSYLSDKGFNSIEIGQLMAVILGSKIIAPYLWGWVADHYNNRILLIRAGAFLAIIAYLGLFYSSQFWWLVLVLALFGFFWNAILPQFEALTLNYLKNNEDYYSWVRMWGSIGFIVAVVLLGFLINKMGSSIVPIIVVLLLIGIALSTLLLQDRCGASVDESPLPMRKILHNKLIIALFISCLLVQASHAPYYTFYTIYAKAHGYTAISIGFLWAIGVFAEVLAFAFMPWLSKRFSLRHLLLLSLFSGSLRWLLIAFYMDNIYLTVFAQIFHASTFGIYHAVAIAYIHQYFKGKHQGKGQALYSSMSFGVGGALGSLYGGYLWQSIGANYTFVIAAILSFIAFAISWKYTPMVAQKNNE